MESNNKIAIVTGGSKGIGASIVKELANNNYTVILNYNNSEEEARKIAQEYNNVFIFKADVSNYEEVKNLVDFTIEKFKKIDLLVNNAGIDLIKTFNETSNEEFKKIIETNLFSVFFLSREVSKYMINQKSGNIINISSVWGSVGASCEVAYSISKGGINSLTKALAKELGPSNIRVNAIEPGIIDTDMNRSLSQDDINCIISDIPLERIGKPEDISTCISFLENNTYITGQIIRIDGGWIN